MVGIYSLSTGLIPFGSLAAGSIASQIGIAPTLAGLGLAAALNAYLVFLTRRSLRTLH
jgi:hypothetical protein